MGTNTTPIYTYFARSTGFAARDANSSGAQRARAASALTRARLMQASWVVAVLYWRDSRSATLAALAGPVTGRELP